MFPTRWYFGFMFVRWALLAAVIVSPLTPQTPAGPLQQALGLFNSGKYEECFNVVAPYVVQNPNSAAAHKLLGMDQFMLGKAREALVEVQRATELDPTDAEAFYYLGRLNFSTDNAAAALQAFQKSLELDPASVRSHNNLGQTYESFGRSADAENEYQKAIALQQDQAKKSEWPYYNLGLLYYNNGRVQDSIPYFRRALECNPAFAEAKIKLAVVLTNQKSGPEALELLKQAIQTEPRNAEAHYRMALLLSQSGKPEEAREHFALFEKYRKQ